MKNTKRKLNGQKKIIKASFQQVDVASSLSRTQASLVLLSIIATLPGSNITKYSGLNTVVKYIHPVKLVSDLAKLFNGVNHQNIVKVFGKRFPQCNTKQQSLVKFNNLEKLLRSETWIEQVKRHVMAGDTLTDDFWANDILWQLSILAYNIPASWRVRQRRNKFKQQEHHSFIDWFISVPAKIERSGHQTELKMYEHHLHKAEWEEFDRLIEAA